MDAVSTLVDSMAEWRLLDPAQVEEVRRQLLPQFATDSRGLAAQLLKRQWLTPLQINRLYAGRGEELLLGNYVLLERLGEGGMGQVFKARNWKLGRIVALKLIRKDLLANAVVVSRFRREIEATAQLDHPHLIRAFDADQTDDGLFIVMEYVEGVDLLRLVKEKGPLPPARACDYIRQAALGLQHAHEKGLIHRDIKPPNLLLDTQSDTIKILDLGLARLQEASEGPVQGMAQPSLTQMGVIVGTVDFIAPEQAKNSRKVDCRADLYAIGGTFHYLLTGRPPYPGGSPTEKLIKHAMDPLPPLAEAPAPVRAVVHRLLAKRPEDRFATAAELAQALEELLAHPEKLQSRVASELPNTVPLLQLPPAPVRAMQPTALDAVPERTKDSRMMPRVPKKTPTGRAKTTPERPTPPPRPALAPETLSLAPPRARPAEKKRRRGLVITLVLLGALAVAVPFFVPPASSKGEPSSSGDKRSVEDKKDLPKPVVPKPPPRWDGVVREFLVVGPSRGEPRFVSQVERNPRPGAVYQDFAGDEIRWAAEKVDPDGALRTASLVIRRPTHFYAQVSVFAPTSRSIKIQIGAADAVRLSVNGEVVHDSLKVNPNPRPDQEKLTAELRQGWNQVLVRLSARGLQPYEFHLRFPDAEDLRIALRPPG